MNINQIQLNFTFFVLLVFTGINANGQEADLSKKWQKFFSEKPYLQKNSSLTEENFWDVVDQYPRLDANRKPIKYKVLFVYSDKEASEAYFSLKEFYDLFSNEGTFSQFVRTTRPNEDYRFSYIDKITYSHIIFDGYLFFRSYGEYRIVDELGPLMLSRSLFSVSDPGDEPEEKARRTEPNFKFHLNKGGKKVPGIVIGNFAKQLSKATADYAELSQKILNKEEGYTRSDENIRRIVSEYNAWVKQNDPERYAASLTMPGISEDIVVERSGLLEFEHRMKEQ